MHKPKGDKSDFSEVYWKEIENLFKKHHGSDRTFSGLRSRFTFKTIRTLHESAHLYQPKHQRIALLCYKTLLPREADDLIRKYDEERKQVSWIEENNLIRYELERPIKREPDSERK